jgi:ParB family transcriptional regulator, chromosome partitioning protein
LYNDGETTYQQYKTTKYANEIYPLGTDEYEELKQSIKERGLYHPIIINQDGDVLDGHHRLKACEELGIKPRFEVKQFDNVVLEELFVIDSNLARRQLTVFAYAELIIVKKEPLLKELAERNMKAGITLSRNQERVHTAEELAEMAGVSKDTLYKVQQIMKSDLFKDNADFKESVESEKISINSAYQQVKRFEDDNKPNDDINSWVARLEGKTDLDRFAMFGKAEYQNDAPRVYNVWNFMQLDPRLGQKHPGQIPGQIAMNVLYYYTKPGDMVIDPMAGGGSTIDACKIMGRKCLAYDIKPMREDIKEWDATTKSFPEEARGCNLVFLDPPYGFLMKKEYSEQSISSLPIDKFLEAMEKIIKASYEVLAPNGHIALVMSGLTDENFEYFIDLPADCINIFKAVGFKQHQRIGVPIPPAVKSALDVHHFKKKKMLLNLNRDLVIFQSCVG